MQNTSNCNSTQHTILLHNPYTQHLHLQYLKASCRLSFSKYTCVPINSSTASSISPNSSGYARSHIKYGLAACAVRMHASISWLDAPSSSSCRDTISMNTNVYRNTTLPLSIDSYFSMTPLANSASALSK